MSITIMQNLSDKCNIAEEKAKVSEFNFDFSALEIGDVVDCVTKIGVLHGEILTFDHDVKLLVLRDSTETRPQMRLINMTHIESIHRISSRLPTFSFKLPKDSHETAQQRLRKAENEKKELWVENVSKEGVELFTDLKKMFGDVCWVDKKNIGVLKCLVVKEPYDENSIEITDKQASSLQCFERIKKLVQRKNNTQNDGRLK